jgi:hypothetical protein
VTPVTDVPRADAEISAAPLLAAAEQPAAETMARTAIGMREFIAIAHRKARAAADFRTNPAIFASSCSRPHRTSERLGAAPGVARHRRSPTPDS